MALRRKERTSPRPPSGDQLEIAHGDQRAIVVEAGGGVRSYSAGGRELLDAYGADEMCKSGRGQVLIPWPNRLQDGSYEFGGQTHQLPLDQLSEHHAIHGLVRWAAWTVREHESDRVVVEHVIHPRPGYPFSLALSIEYRLSGEGLRVATTATNVGAARCPYGCGAHPYLTLGTATIDSLALQVPAGTVLQSDERGIPVGTAPVEGTEYDFRQPREIGRTEMDNGFTDLERDHEGVARVELRDPNGGRALSLWVGRELSVPDDLHRRPASRRRPPQPRGRAHDLPAERLSYGSGPDLAGPRPVRHVQLGNSTRTAVTPSG